MLESIFHGRGGVSKRLTIILCVAAGSAAAVPLAGAHTTRITSLHSLGFSPDVASDLFTGQVGSEPQACQRERPITLYRKVGDASVPDAAVATTTTNDDGIWTRGFSDAAAGRYYAVATKRVIRRPGHKHVCLAARSNTVTVEPDPPPDSAHTGAFTS